MRCSPKTRTQRLAGHCVARMKGIKLCRTLLTKLAIQSQTGRGLRVRSETEPVTKRNRIYGGIKTRVFCPAGCHLPDSRATQDQIGQSSTTRDSSRGRGPRHRRPDHPGRSDRTRLNSGSDSENTGVRRQETVAAFGGVGFRRVAGNS